MSAIQDLRSYVERLRGRFRLGVVARGAALLGLVALLTTVVLTLLISQFAFSRGSLWSARVVLILALASAAVFGLALPLWHWTQRWWTRRAERAFPQFEQRLVTFAERDSGQPDPFLELLAADALRVAETADPKVAVPDRLLVGLLVVGVLAVVCLLGLIRAGPGYWGYGAAAIWTGPPTTPYYTVHVSPGDATVRRNADQLVTAELPGLLNEQLHIHVRYHSAAQWEETLMQPRPASPGFQFLFAGIPEDVEYYVDTGSIHTAHFHLRVADVPTVKQIRVTYHHPDWMHLADTVEEHGGDLRAIEGTRAQLEVVTDRPVTRGVLTLDDGREIALTASSSNVYQAAITIDKDGAYHVATRDTAQEQRLSEDYFIQATAVKPPEVALVRPERDYRASPIEEMTVAATASDPFGLSDFSLHYSVNGGPEQVVDLMKPPGAPAAPPAASHLDGSTLLALESLKLIPGDVVGFYAVAKDARTEAHTDISFIQIEPFERQFSQSQQSGGGGGGGFADDQAQIAQREKEIIQATWKQAGSRTTAAREAAEQAKFLSDVQATLRNQANALAGRLEMRDIQLANQQFGSFQQDMAAAAAAMRPAAQKLNGQQWSAAVFDEQRALQHLLRAEATFRQIEVAIGSRGGGGGAVNSAGRDLASLFDLELDTQKNQYEGAQTAADANHKQTPVDDALKKLDELARRQSELAQRHNSDAQQSAEERWQQEMLRRKAEELQRQLEELARNSSASQGSSADSSSSDSGRPSAGRNGGSAGDADANTAGQSGAQAGQRAGDAAGQSGSKAGQGARSAAARDAFANSIRQAQNTLREAQEDMRRAVDDHNAADARRAAERLHDAMNLLARIQQQDASRQVDSLSHEADRLASQQREQAERLRGLINERTRAQGSAGGVRGGVPVGGAVESLINDRQKLADDLARLSRDMRSAEHATAARSRGVADKLHSALGDLEQADTETQLQRSADQLRRGYIPLGDSSESEIASALGRLKDQLADAQQARVPSSDDPLDTIQRLRDRLAALDQRGRSGDGQGEASGHSGSRDASGRADGDAPGRGGDGQGDASGPNSPGRSAQKSSALGDDPRLAGPVGRNAGGANRGGPINGGWNTGNNAELPHTVAPNRSPPPADREQFVQQGLRDLDQLRRSVGDDPAARREVDDLIRSMQRLDPKRFPGNPAMVDDLYAKVLGDVDKLELQLRHDPTDDTPAAQVRSESPPPIPPDYQSAVADYYRRLSQTR